MVSRVSPAFSSVLAHVEKTPCSTCLMATRNSPESGLLHSEYERRTSCPLMMLRRVKY